MTTLTLEQKIEARWPVKYRLKEYGKVPTGYMINQLNPKELLPDLEVIAVIEEAFDLNEGGTGLRELVSWVNEKAGINITFVTLGNLYNRHRKPYVTRKRRLKREPPKVSKTVVKKRIIQSNYTKSKKRYEELLQKEKEKARREELKKNPKTQRVNLDVIHQEPVRVPKLTPEQEILFKPNPGPQDEFLKAPEREVLFGGAAGGEPKSWFYRLLSSQEVKINLVNCWKPDEGNQQRSLR